MQTNPKKREKGDGGARKKPIKRLVEPGTLPKEVGDRPNPRSPFDAPGPKYP